MKKRLLLINAVVAIAASGIVHEMKADVRDDRAALSELSAERAAALASISTLRNEVAYLERPDRLRALAERHLGLAPADPARVVSVEDAGLVLAQIRHSQRESGSTLTESNL